jgi:hypothetical protein
MIPFLSGSIATNPPKCGRAVNSPSKTKRPPGSLAHGVLTV